MVTSLLAVEPSDGAPFNDGVDRTDPNFVKASLLVVGPEDVLYSLLGHSCIRMECPRFNLDKCFSYESEAVRDRIFAYLAGTLKMRLWSLPTETFLDVQRRAGRQVDQYELNLPIESKRELWRILDEAAARDVDVPYDSLQRGCAQSILRNLNAAVPGGLVYGTWPQFSTLTIRERCLEALDPFPWSQFFLNGLYGTVIDRENPRSQRIVVPADLVDVLRRATVAGRKVIVGEPVELAHGTVVIATTWFTPLVASLVLLAVALFGSVFESKLANVLVLLSQGAAGLLLVHLMCFNKTTAGWNWLIVPFCPLTAVFWRWRRHWALPYVALLLLWSGWMFLSPHRLTHAPCLVAAVAFMTFYASLGLKMNYLKVKGKEK